MRLDSLYQEIILDHYRRPRRKGLRDPYDIEVHHVNPTCGDEVTLRVQLESRDGVIMVGDVSYEGEGCSISQASTSVMAEIVTGHGVDEGLAAAARFRELMDHRSDVNAEAADLEDDVLQDAVAFAGVAKYPARVKCALLGWMAWKDATAQAMAAPNVAGHQQEASA